MSSNLCRALEAAHSALIDIDDDDNAYELESIIAMFRPHQGDDPELARTRIVKKCTCKNCGESWGAMAMPAPLTDVAITGQRLAKCPRCFATEDIFLTA